MTEDELWLTNRRALMPSGKMLEGRARPFENGRRMDRSQLKKKEQQQQQHLAHNFCNLQHNNSNFGVATLQLLKVPNIIQAYFYKS